MGTGRGRGGLGGSRPSGPRSGKGPCVRGGSLRYLGVRPSRPGVQRRPEVPAPPSESPRPACAPGRPLSEVPAAAASGRPAAAPGSQRSCGERPSSRGERGKRRLLPASSSHGQPHVHAAIRPPGDAGRAGVATVSSLGRPDAPAPRPAAAPCSGAGQGRTGDDGSGETRAGTCVGARSVGRARGRRGAPGAVRGHRGRHRDLPGLALSSFSSASRGERVRGRGPRRNSSHALRGGGPAPGHRTPRLPPPWGSRPDQPGHPSWHRARGRGGRSPGL